MGVRELCITDALRCAYLYANRHATVRVALFQTRVSPRHSHWPKRSSCSVMASLSSQSTPSHSPSSKAYCLSTPLLECRRWRRRADLQVVSPSFLEYWPP